MLISELGSILWSKDRASQLELFLRSLKRFFPELGSIYVLYKCSNEKYKAGYKKVMQAYPYHKYVKETNFKEDMMRLVGSFNMRFILNFNDDDVFIRRPEYLEEMLGNFTDEYFAISLRLADNITYTYPSNITTSIPDFIKDDNYIVWNWTECERMSDWGYPCAASTTIYELDFYKWYVDNLNFTNPTTFEGCMNHNRRSNKPLLMSHKKTIVLNIPANRTQTVNNNKCEGMSLEELNNAFLDDYIIDDGNIFHVENTMAAQPIPFRLIRR